MILETLSINELFELMGYFNITRGTNIFYDSSKRTNKKTCNWHSVQLVTEQTKYVGSDIFFIGFIHLSFTSINKPENLKWTEPTTAVYAKNLIKLFNLEASLFLKKILNKNSSTLISNNSLTRIKL